MYVIQVICLVVIAIGLWIGVTLEFLALWNFTSTWKEHDEDADATGTPER